jgi:hypothetical protein
VVKRRSVAHPATDVVFDFLYRARFAHEIFESI